MLIAPDDAGQHWLVVRTKPKQERLAVDALQARELEAYCPRILEPPAHLRAARGPSPLFPSYIFARAAARESLSALAYCPHAAGLLRFGGLLAAVEDEVIGALREREGERGYLEPKTVRRVPRPGERARVVRGALAGLEGVVVQYLPARDRVRLLLTLLTGTRRVEVEAAHVRCA